MRRKITRWAGLLILAVATVISYCNLSLVQALDTAIGDGVLLYGETGNTSPRQRSYLAANSFGSEAGTVTGAVPLNTVVKTSPTKQEAIGGYINASGTLQIMCYDGTSWVNEWTAAVGNTGTTGRFDIAFETTTGDAMVVYSTDAATTNELAYRTKAGSSDCGSANWSSATNIDAVRTSGIVWWVRAEASPVSGSNTIGIAWSDANSDLSGMEWTGASWAVAEPASAFETTIENAAAAGDVLAFDIAFESLTGNFLVVWGVGDPAVACTAGVSCIKYARYTSSWSAATVVPTVADNATSIDISANPYTDQIVMGAIDNRASDLSVAYWSGSAWTGTANLDASASTPAAGQKLVATGWLVSGATTRSIVAYADATVTTTSISFYTGNAGTFTVGTDFAGSPTPGAFRWFDMQIDPFNADRLMLTYSDANSDLFAKRLVMTSTPGFTFTNSDASAALEATLGQATSSPFSFAYWRYIPLPAAAQGDGQIVYGEGTVATPRTRQYSTTTSGWTAEASLPTNTSTTHSTVVKSAPTRNETLAAVTNSSGVLNLYRWNGTSWSSEWTVTTGIDRTPRVTIAYEQVSGDAVVMYSTNTVTTNEIAYRVWNGSSWTGAANFDPVRTNNIIHYLVAKPRPGTDEIALAWADAEADLSAAYWTGSAWGSEPAATLETELAQANGAISTPHNPMFDLAFEESSGRLMVMWGENLSTNVRYVLRSAGTGGTWGSTVSPSGFVGQGVMIKLTSRPGSDDIAYITHSNYSHTEVSTWNSFEAAAWNGTAWTVSGEYPAGLGASEGEFDVSVEWIESGGTVRALYVLDIQNSGGIDYFYYDKAGGTFSAVTSYTGAPSPPGTDDKLMRAVRNPYNGAEVFVFAVDSLNDLYTKKVTFDGSSFTWTSLEPAGAPMEVNLSAPANIKGWITDFDYRRFFVSGTLTTDIVDSDGVSVGSPSLDMASTAASSDCQTTTGTFGVSAQKIRVTNGTGTPGWALSIAATSGATSSWSSGTANYDFNDTSGSPAGCGDGGDADSLAGRLSVDPSASTITPQGGCSGTGVTAGSSSGFTQGSTDSVTLMSASGSAQTNCYWDMTGVGLSQKIPSFQAAGGYAINMTVTVVAN